MAREPNRRVQDTLRLPLMCDDCEERISAWEAPFGREMFSKLAAHAALPYPYGPWMLRFGVSVAWRVLLAHLHLAPDLHVLTERHRKMVPEALERWRAFMRGEQPHPGDHQIHFMSLGLIANYSGSAPPAGTNWYFTRALEIDVIEGGEHGALTYAKMGPALFVGFISPPSRQEWRGTMLHVRKGQFEGRVEAPMVFGRYLEDRVRRAIAVGDALSAQQRSKIGEAYRRDPSRVAKSATLSAVRADEAMFGGDVFSRFTSE